MSRPKCRPYKRPTFQPNYQAGVEVPYTTLDYAEGVVRVYGSGILCIELLALPIVVRVPVVPTPDRFWFRAVYPARLKEVSMLRKVVNASQPAAASGGPGVADAASWPCLLEYLTATVYPDGQARETSAVIIVCDAAGWRGCVSDKDNGRTLWRAATTLEGLLLSLEEALATDDPAAWRQSAGKALKGKKRS